MGKPDEGNKMKDISAVEDKETLKYVIRQELKSYGIKVPKEKRSSVRCTQAQQGKASYLILSEPLAVYFRHVTGYTIHCTRLPNVTVDWFSDSKFINGVKIIRNDHGYVGSTWCRMQLFFGRFRSKNFKKFSNLQLLSKNSKT